VRFRHLIHVVSIILIALSVPLAATAILALLFRDGSFLAFLGATVVAAGAGMIGFRTTSLTRDLSIREGYAVVSLSWLAIGIVGAIPYVLSGVVASPVAALFESVSGFTTRAPLLSVFRAAVPPGLWPQKPPLCSRYQ